MRKIFSQRWSSRVFTSVAAGVIFVLLRARVADAPAEGDAGSRSPDSAQRACDALIPGFSATRIRGTAIPDGDPVPDDDSNFEEPLWDDGMSDVPFRGPPKNSAIGLGICKRLIEQELRP